MRGDELYDFSVADQGMQPFRVKTAASVCWCLSTRGRVTRMTASFHTLLWKPLALGLRPVDSFDGLDKRWCGLVSVVCFSRQFCTTLRETCYPRPRAPAPTLKGWCRGSGNTSGCRCGGGVNVELNWCLFSEADVIIKCNVVMKSLLETETYYPHQVQGSAWPGPWAWLCLINA